MPSRFSCHRTAARTRRRSLIGSVLVLAWALLLCLAGCTGEDPAPVVGEPRLVSLAPTLTTMLDDLGELDRLVGVAQYDSVAPPGTPVVGNYVGVDVERLLSVRPTLVLTMTGKEGVPARLRQLADEGRFELRAWHNPNPFRIEHALAILIELGDVLGKPHEAAALRERFLRELERIHRVVADHPTPRVLLVIGIYPVMASGPGTAHDQMLRRAGGVNAAADAAVTAPTFDREALIAMQPQVILLLLPNDPPLTTNDERLRPFRDLPVPAVEKDRVILLNDPEVLLTGTSMVRTVRRMAEAIHPDAEWSDE